MVKEAKPLEQTQKTLELPPTISVKQLSELVKANPVDIIKQLMRNGVMASINQVIDFDTAAVIAADLGFESHLVTPPPAQKAEAKKLSRPVATGDALQTRPPVVTIMGHVDHGKTSLLDAIRQTNVTATEAGGITQHIGAYQVEVNGRKVTFLDTPGHEAFTAMRARGAQITDIAVVVVAADDGIMPQTIEAIDHARAAGVPIVVAINKIDKPGANADLVKKQLADHGLVIEEWGGDTVCVAVSAKKKLGISDLLENILIVADVAELKANPQQIAEGTVIEAELDKTRGSLAKVLIQNGTLYLGDTVIAGDTWGKVKAMFNDKGKRIKQAGPATPVAILGLSGVPRAGDLLIATAENQARSILEKRLAEEQLKAQVAKKSITLDDLFAQVSQGKVKDLNIVLKTDVQGSIEPIKNSLEKLSTEQVRVRAIHSGTGSITESDVLLAMASRGIIIGFNSSPQPGAKHLAETEGVDIRVYSIIYNVMDDVQKALKGMLEPTYQEVIEGRGRVITVFPHGRKLRIAGILVSEGKLSRSSKVRVLRQGQVVADTSFDSLRRFKDNVSEVMAGLEAGILLEGYNDFQEGDVIEAYRKERSN